MLTREENEAITRVGPGTPMGELMRRYWMPALLTEELPAPDCPPVRVRLLGENLVAFRDSGGRVGLVDEACPHRRASLWFGRNEECGLRCVFHGWKFDVDGRCVDLMNEPDEFDFRDKVRLKAYPTLELAGLVWTYMGPAGSQPPAPAFEWTRVPDAARHVNKTWQECNWLQGLEGGIDTSHAPILHRRIRKDTDLPGVPPDAPFVTGKPPKLEVEVTDYGYRYYGVREVKDGLYVRGYQFIMPFTQIRPGTDFGGQALVAGHMWVPMDDENCMVYNWEYSTTGEAMADPELVARELGTGHGEQDALYRKTRNRANDYLIDREAQRTETFTGIFGVNVQDHAVQESMGAIMDRTREYLGPADKAIIAARRLLLEGTQVVADGGQPKGQTDVGETGYGRARAGAVTVPATTDWRAPLLAEMNGH
jgi:phthalate 4,5-dioxygenase oxygenase subunit